MLTIRARLPLKQTDVGSFSNEQLKERTSLMM
jgi:hypothetical protein